MSAARVFVTWPMESQARALLERVGTVETSPTEAELPEADLIRHVARAEAVIPMEGRRPPNLINPEAWRS